jgi:hypothetical protein
MQRLPYMHAVRDGLIVLVTLGLWWVDAGLRARGRSLALEALLDDVGCDRR